MGTGGKKHPKNQTEQNKETYQVLANLIMYTYGKYCLVSASRLHCKTTGTVPALKAAGSTEHRINPKYFYICTRTK